MTTNHGDESRATQGVFSLLATQLRPHWKRFGVAVLLSVGASTLSLAQPILVARIVTALETTTELLPSVAILLSLLITSAILSGLQTYTLGTLGEQITSRVRSQFTSSVLILPISRIETYRRADLVARVTADSTLLRVALTDGAGQIIGGAIMFAGALIAMALVSVTLLLATLAAVTLGLLFLLALSGRMRQASSSVQEQVARIGSTLDQSILAVKTIRSLDATSWATTRLERDVDAARDAGIRFARITAAITPLSGVVMQISLAVVLGLGAHQVTTGSLTVAQLVAFVMYVFLLLAPVGQAVTAITSFAQASAAARRLAEIEERTSPSGRNETIPAQASIAWPNSTSADAVRFSNVHFTYPTAQATPSEDNLHPALTDISFVIPRGGKVGIVGPSGAGKSTIFNLISGFYTPVQGAIQVMGQSEVRDIQGVIGLVEQDAPIIAGTLRENLTLGDTSITDAACYEALAKANLEYLHNRGPGLDLELSDQGSNLSGGERQRLAIARVLLRSRPILLLDESTSQMDSENELKLRDAIAEAGLGRTTIVIAHRLSTIIDSDLLIVLRDGQIEAQGQHNELVQSSPTYAAFARQQRLSHMR